MNHSITNAGNKKIKQMKFIHYLEKVSGIDIYGLSSFLLFMSFFIIILAWAIKADKKTIDEISRIPLD
jgi:hypothetical protein